MERRYALTVTRRHFLLAASSLSTLSGVGLGGAIAATETSPRCLIDVHCHIFNARDVPTTDFVLNVAAREHGAGGLLAAFGAFLVAILSMPAPTAGEEQRRIASAQRLDTVALTDEQFRSHVSATLAQLNAAAAVAPPAAILSAPTTQTLLNSGTAVEELVLPFDGIAPNPEARALLELRRRYGLAGSSPQTTPQLMTPFELHEALPESGPVLSPAAQQGLADAIVADVKAVSSGASGDDLARLFAMARIFLSYRIENVRTLDSTIKRSADMPDVRLYCPALVDFDSWLGVRLANASTGLREQIGLMSQISLSTEASLLVNGYMAFDPLRAAMQRLVPLNGVYDPLFLVRMAVSDYGFIGVKLYPPMGFRPWGNAGANQDYGRFASRWMTDHHIALDRFEAKLDEVLAELYDWCLSEDVPILAHCGNSQAAFEQSGLRADPEHWEKLLQSRSPRGKEYAGLRINLAHMGAVWCHVDPAIGRPPERDPSDEYNRCQAAIGWSEKLFKMLAAGGANPIYPNLYADLADVAAIARDDSRMSERDRDGRMKTIEVLQALIRQSGQPERVLPKLLYGTDWMFLAMFAQFESFADGAAILAGRIGSTSDDLLWHNAARFLGLVKRGPDGRDSKTVARLRRFYRARPDKLKSLDALLI
jgi:predicted TIM-barrel fold metal-dependent hydrolase